MRKATVTAALMLAIALPALAKKIEGTTTLKDFQPYGTKDKDHKHQGYELLFQATGKQYSCRTDPKHSVNAIDFLVGSSVKYELDGNKAKLTSMEGKEVECMVVRVEAVPATK